MAPRPSLLTHQVRFAHLPSGAHIAWARSGCLGGPVLLRAGHWMTHVEQDLRSPLWRPLIERLGRTFELVRYDERGFGLSTGDDVELGVAPAVEELECVAAAHGAQRFALLGISGGAAAAIGFAARHPQRVSHLVLLGGSTHGSLHRSPTADTLAYFEAQVRLVELGWGRNDPGVQQLFTSRFMPGGNTDQWASFNEHQRLSCNGHRAAALLRARAGADVREQARGLTVPTLVLHSEGDLAVPLALGQDMAATIPGARFEILASRNHIPLYPELALERLCQAITEFVTPAAASAALTGAERELGALVAKGLDNLQIAAHLGLAEKTVRNRLSALYARLDVEGRAMAVVKTRELGL